MMMLLVVSNSDTTIIIDGNQVEDASQAQAQAQVAQAQEGAQAQRITRSMARASGEGHHLMTLVISLV